jgi:hypothetical protein
MASATFPEQCEHLGVAEIAKTVPGERRAVDYHT